MGGWQVMREDQLLHAEPKLAAQSEGRGTPKPAGAYSVGPLKAYK